jgi:hypothetical protein
VGENTINQGLWVGAPVGAEQTFDVYEGSQ